MDVTECKRPSLSVPRRPLKNLIELVFWNGFICSFDPGTLQSPTVELLEIASQIYGRQVLRRYCLACHWHTSWFQVLAGLPTSD